MADEKKRILKLVESGKLTVEEALALIEKVDQVNERKNIKAEDQELLDELTEDAKFKEKKSDYGSNTFNFNAAKEKLFDFVDSTIKKVKEVDLDLNFGHSEEVSHVFQYTEVLPKNIDIDLPNGEVEIIPWDQQEVRLECKAKVYRVNTPEEAKDTFLKEVKVNVDEHLLEVKSIYKWMKLKIQLYIPKATYESVKTRLFTGPITAYELQADSLYTKTANGKVTLKNGEHNKVEVDAANGSILVEKAIINELDAETINGTINVDGSFKKVDLQSFNGNITCTNHSSDGEYIEVEGTTGSIEINIDPTTSVKGQLKTNFGGFNVELEGIQIVGEKNEVLQKTLNFESIKESDQQTVIEASTKTGSIKVQKIE